VVMPFNYPFDTVRRLKKINGLRILYFSPQAKLDLQWIHSEKEVRRQNLPKAQR